VRDRRSHKEEAEGVTRRDRRSHWDTQKESLGETEGATKERQKGSQKRDRRSHCVRVTEGVTGRHRRSHKENTEGLTGRHRRSHWERQKESRKRDTPRA
jgi:hypothetical protein